MSMDQTTRLHGPFASLAEFNDFLVAPVQDCPRPELAAKYRNVPSDDYCIMFACADFSGENILVDPENGSVTGMAGFWPKWWEFRRALFIWFSASVVADGHCDEPTLAKTGVEEMQVFWAFVMETCTHATQLVYSAQGFVPYLLLRPYAV